MDDVPRLTSRQHPIVRRCRRVAGRRGEADVILLDGAHLLTEALDAGVPIQIVVTGGEHPDLARRAQHAGAAVYEASADVLDALSPVRSPSGVVALATWTPPPVDRLLDHHRALVIGLVGVQDPGNVGGVIRAADALGATGVIAFEQSAEPASVKALRGAMGSTFRLPVASARLADVLPEARRRGLRVAAAVAHDGEPPDAANLAGPLLILLGNEGRGLPGTLIDETDIRITIPMRPRVDSLNVAVTAAILLWEAVRHRGAAPAERR